MSHSNKILRALKISCILTKLKLRLIMFKPPRNTLKRTQTSNIRRRNYFCFTQGRRYGKKIIVLSLFFTGDNRCIKGLLTSIHKAAT